jgi:hypothetical protein
MSVFCTECTVGMMMMADDEPWQCTAAVRVCLCCVHTTVGIQYFEEFQRTVLLSSDRTI